MSTVGTDGLYIFIKVTWYCKCSNTPFVKRKDMEKHLREKHDLTDKQIEDFIYRVAETEVGDWT